MTEFITMAPLAIGRSGKWQLYGPWIYQSELLEQEVKIPAGFETDLASIPRVFTPLISKNGRHRKAAIVHDYLYSIKGALPEQNLTRKVCDDVFLEAMKHCGVKLWKRWAMYSAVRAGGWIYFNKT